MGETVFQQQARLQAAQVGQNQALIAMQQAQIGMLQQASDAAARTKALVHEAFETSQAAKLITKTAATQPQIAMVMIREERLRIQRWGITPSVLPDINSKEALASAQEQLSDVQASIGATTTPDMEAVHSALDTCRRLRASIGGPHVDQLEANENQRLANVEAAVRGAIPGWVMKGIFGLFTLGCLFGFVVLYHLIMDIKASYGILEQTRNENRQFAENAGRYRAWLRSSDGGPALEAFFAAAPSVLPVVDARHATP